MGINFEEQSITSKIVRVIPDAIVNVLGKPKTEAERLTDSLEEARVENSRKEEERVATAQRNKADRARRLENERERVKSFRTVADNERAQRAAATVARMRDAMAAAESAASAAEAACVQDPDATGAFDKARSARKSVDDAAGDLKLALASSAKVESDIGAKEQRSIKIEIEQRQARLLEIVDDEALDSAVDHAVRAIEMLHRHEARIAQYEDEVAILHELRARIGDTPTPEEIAAHNRTINGSWVRIAEVALSASAQFARELGRPQQERVGHWWPMSRDVYKVVLQGTENFHVSGANGDGEPLTTGEDRRPLVSEAAALLERVKGRRGDKSGGSKLASVATAGAAVLALATSAALTLAGG